jgi:NDP-sugar pyrophosphorylase family protein
VLPAQMSRGLLAFKSDGYFIDIGIPEDFARAQRDLPHRQPGCDAEVDVAFDKLAGRSLS